MSEPEAELRARMHEVDALLREVEASPDGEARARTQAIVRAVLGLHRSAIARMLELARGTEPVEGGLLEAFARDPRVAPLLLLHDLHPLGLADRVAAALEGARPALRALGATVEGLEVDDRRIGLRVRTSGCGEGRTERVRQALEDALCATAPDAPPLEIATR